jgi:DNA polymerase-3 subunit alpha
VEAILAARQIDGTFNSLEDFFAKVDVHSANRKALESLIKAGGFDRYNERSVLLHNLDNFLAYAGRLQKDRTLGQTDLFGGTSSEKDVKTQLVMVAPDTEITLREKLLWERELLGLYLSQHPLANYEVFLSRQTVPLSELKPEQDGKPVIIGGTINDVREITTKNGQKMAFVKLEDRSGEVELVVFPSIFQQTPKLWERDRVVLVNAKVSNKDRSGHSSNEVKTIADSAREITAEEAQTYQPTGQIDTSLPTKPIIVAMSAKMDETTTISSPAQPAKRVFIRLQNSNDQKLLLSLKNTLDMFSGNTDVVLIMGPDKNKQVIKLPTGISDSLEPIQSLQKLVGTDNVRLH